MYRALPLFIFAAVAGGCEVVPAPAYVAPAGVVYVQPVAPMPAPGYIWMYHPEFGWGWHHQREGWYGHPDWH